MVGVSYGASAAALDAAGGITRNVITTGKMAVMIEASRLDAVDVGRISVTTLSRPVSAFAHSLLLRFAIRFCHWRRRVRVDRRPRERWVAREPAE